MKVTFFNSAFVNAPSFMVSSSWKGKQKLKVRFAILEHDTWGPVVIDGGYGPEAAKSDRSFWLQLYWSILRPDLTEGVTPVQALKSLGYEPGDVPHILVSHMHADHVCGLDAFPQAKVLMSRHSKVLACREEKFLKLKNGIFSELSEGWHRRAMLFESMARSASPDFGLCFDPFGDGSVLAVPLPGHGVGHFGFYFAGLDAPLLYAVDVAWTLDAVRRRQPGRFLAALVSESRKCEIASLEKVGAFMDRGGDVVLCHDPAPHPCDWEVSS